MGIPGDDGDVDDDVDLDCGTRDMDASVHIVDSSSIDNKLRVLCMIGYFMLFGNTV